MNRAGRYYEHSGTVGLLGPIYMLIFGAVSALLLGAIYGFAIFYIPFIYLNFIMTLGLGGIVGYSVGLGGKIGKVRSSTTVFFFGLIFGIIAEYVGWISWIYASSDNQLLVLLPSNVIGVIEFVAETGAWTIFSSTPSGIFLYLIWGIEAAMIIGLSTIVASLFTSSTPFCERCEKWVEDEETIFPLDPVASEEELKSQLELGDYAYLKSLGKLEEVAGEYTKLGLVHCPDCQNSHFLNVKSVLISVDSDNKVSTGETSIVENLILSFEQFKMIKEQWPAS